MAEFYQGASSPLTPKKVISGVFAVEAEKKAYWTKYKGEGASSIVQVVPALNKEPGDQVTVALRMKLRGDGITGDDILSGNESNLDFRNMTVKVDQRRNAVKLSGKMTEKRSAIKLRKEAVDALSTWAAEVDDEEIFYHLSCARGVRAGTLSTAYAGGPNAFVTPDDSHLVGGGGKAASGGIVPTLAAGDTLKASDIDNLVEQARLLDPQIQPIRVEGGDYWILLISPEQATDLRNDNAWLNAQRDAGPRDYKANNLFTGAMGFYNSVVVHVNRNVVKFSAYGNNSIAAARALLLGQQAGIVAPGDGGWDYDEERMDYKNKVGFSVGQINGVAGSAFQPEGSTTKTLYGRILLDTAI